MLSQPAWDKLAQQEADALAQLLANEGRCVMVTIVGADTDDLGTTHVCHGVAGDTRGRHLRQFIAGLERKLARLNDKLGGRG